MKVVSMNWKQQLLIDYFILRENEKIIHFGFHMFLKFTFEPVLEEAEGLGTLLRSLCE